MSPANDKKNSGQGNGGPQTPQETASGPTVGPQTPEETIKALNAELDRLIMGKAALEESVETLNAEMGRLLTEKNGLEAEVASLLGQLDKAKDWEAAPGDAVDPGVLHVVLMVPDAYFQADEPRPDTFPEVFLFKWPALDINVLWPEGMTAKEAWRQYVRKAMQGMRYL